MSFIFFTGLEEKVGTKWFAIQFALKPPARLYKIYGEEKFMSFQCLLHKINEDWSFKIFNIKFPTICYLHSSSLSIDRLCNRNVLTNLEIGKLFTLDIMLKLKLSAYLNFNTEQNKQEFSLIPKSPDKVENTTYLSKIILEKYVVRIERGCLIFPALCA